MFKIFYGKPAQKKYRYSNGDEQNLLCYIISDFAILLVFTSFGVISPKNSTLFTRPFLAGRRTQGGDETSIPHACACTHADTQTHTPYAMYLL